MKKWVSAGLIKVGIMTVVILLWQLLEMFITGDIQPSKVDSIVGVILTLSLYENFKTWGRDSN